MTRLYSSAHGNRRPGRRGKRLFDLAGATLLLVPALPIIAAISLLVWARMGRPIFFAQMRPGLHHKPFRMIKFRTMLEAYGPDGALRPDDERLTRLGRFLRASSLDELPELVNVLRGDMSLVGPRPLLMQYLPLYSAEQARRHDVRPGITGWAQIKGRNTLNWQQKFALDVWYVDNRTIALDIRILWLSVGQVLGRQGISAPGEATMAAFTGNGDAASSR